MKTFKIYFIGYILSAVCFFSCKKQDAFLNAVTDNHLAVINNLNQLQLIEQDERIFNSVHDPGFGIVSADDYYITNTTWASLASSPADRNAYIWAKDIYPNLDVSDWDLPYTKIYYANLVLDELAGIKYESSQQSLYNQIKATALFYRSSEYWNLLQIFSKPFISSSANTDLGVPLRLTSDLEQKIPRSSVAACYKQVISDLQLAASLLPIQSTYPTQPTSGAAKGFLARVYLSMNEYDNAAQAATAALNLNSNLEDFNDLVHRNFYLTTTSLFPLKEMLNLTTANQHGILSIGNEIVDSTLYKSYESSDLRKSFYFQQFANATRFTGSYSFKSSIEYFTGIANDEVFLIRAECNARQGNTASAMNDLNTLLVKRYATGTYLMRSASDSDDALNQILAERRKELVFRGLRWSDLRRLNQDSKYAITLTRIINGTTYTLPPNDPRYVFALPDEEINLTGVPQNQR